MQLHLCANVSCMKLGTLKCGCSYVHAFLACEHSNVQILLHVGADESHSKEGRVISLSPVERLMMVTHAYEAMFEEN